MQIAKKVLTLVIVGVLIAGSSTPLFVQAATFSGGTGSSVNPYMIDDCQQLQDIDQDLTAHYELVQAIDCSGTTSWNSGKGFDPIGDHNSPFSGSFDGNGFAVTGLYIDRADDDPNENQPIDESYVGLFGASHNATISDLRLNNAMVKGYKSVGGIVGEMDGGSINDVSVNQSVADNDCDPGYCVWARYGENGGGIVGHLVDGTVTNVRVGGPVKGSGIVIGGVVGLLSDGTLNDARVTSNIDGGRFVGGVIGSMAGGSADEIMATGSVQVVFEGDFKSGYGAGGVIGYLSAGSVSQAFASGDVSARYEGGGFIGIAEGGEISDSYATGDVSSNGEAGGFAGAMRHATIRRVYSSGQITAPNYAGSFSGYKQYDDGAVSDSFTVGSVNAPYPAGFIGVVYEDGEQGLTDNYFDITSTGQTDCTNDNQGTKKSCDGVTGINQSGRQSQYFYDYGNCPFFKAGNRVWSDSVWYFDGSHLPVLRVFASNSPSVPVADSDQDGVASSVESGAPNGGDGNYDGTSDNQQANVTSFVNPVTQKYVTLAASNDCSVTAISAEPESSSKRDTSYHYPAGLIDYQLVCDSGQTSNISLFYAGMNASNMQLRKFNSVTGAYGPISTATIAPYANGIVTMYSVTDGGALDEDGIVNGVIKDPVGLSQLVTVTNQDGKQVGAPNTGVAQGNPWYIIAMSTAAITLLTVARRLWRKPYAKYIA